MTVFLLYFVVFVVYPLLSATLGGLAAMWIVARMIFKPPKGAHAKPTKPN